MIGPPSSPSPSHFPSSTRPLSRRIFYKLRPSLVLTVALATIPSITRAFVVAGTRNQKKSFFGGELQIWERLRKATTATRRNTTTMSFYYSSQSKRDLQTSFSHVNQRLESPSAERNKDPIWEVLSTRVIPFLNHRDSSGLPWMILETAAGAGVHTVHFASKLLQTYIENDGNDDSQPRQPSFVWHPTDPSEEALQSIEARVEGECVVLNAICARQSIPARAQEDQTLGLVVATPQRLTLGASGINPNQSAGDPLPVKENPLDLVLSINMIHIAPWEATLGLMKLAGERLLEPSSDSSEYDGGFLYCYGPYKQDGIIVPSNENFDMSLRSRNPGWGVRNLVDVVEAAENEGLELVENVNMPANNTSLIFRRRRSNPKN